MKFVRLMKKLGKFTGKKLANKVKRDIDKIKRETKSFAFFFERRKHGYYN